MTVTQGDPPSAKGGGFDDLGLEPRLLGALARLNFHTPTDIQWQMIPPALAGRDCLGQARTGTGKTAAFALPMLQRLEPHRAFQALVLVPTRELAVQVDEHVRQLGAEHPAKIVLLYGGQRLAQQARKLRNKPEIVIGTPGRIQDFMRRQMLDLSGVKLVVLDEVDRMLDIGFREDIRRILRAVKSKHQTIFVSATIDREIRGLAKTFMRDPVELNVSQDKLTVDEVEQGYVTVAPQDKVATLKGLIKHESPELMIVFTNTRHAARRLADRLKKSGINCKEIHGNLMQSRRDRVMRAFRKAHIQVLVATDLASRGLDVMQVSHIINYDVPEDPSGYVHRIGRTARMGKSGRAITFVCPDEGNLLTEIEKLVNKELTPIKAPWVRKLPPPPKEPEPSESNGRVPSRFGEPLRRDEELEKSGARPVRRTLGSRFRSTRRSRL
jgi:ATP-dependent RNA helicase DeaD